MRPYVSRRHDHSVAVHAQPPPRMDYFSKFLKQGAPVPAKAPVDHAHEFNKSWNFVKVQIVFVPSAVALYLC